MYTPLLTAPPNDVQFTVTNTSGASVHLHPSVSYFVYYTAFTFTPNVIRHDASTENRVVTHNSQSVRFLAPSPVGERFKIEPNKLRARGVAGNPAQRSLRQSTDNTSTGSDSLERVRSHTG